MSACSAMTLKHAINKAVKKIKDKRFFDLHLFLRALEPLNTSALAQQRVNPGNETDDQQPEENIWLHEVAAELFPRGGLMQVLL